MVLQVLGRVKYEKIDSNLITDEFLGSLIKNFSYIQCLSKSEIANIQDDSTFLLTPECVQYIEDYFSFNNYQVQEKADEERRAKVSNVEVGLVTEGTVESLQPYGAFVNLGNGLTGLVHISQISEKRIKHPSAVLAVGDKVKVKVIAVKDGKLSLSMKALQDVAAQEIEEEVYELPETEEATTTLGSLFANIKLS